MQRVYDSLAVLERSSHVYENVLRDFPRQLKHPFRRIICVFTSPISICVGIRPFLNNSYFSIYTKRTFSLHIALLDLGTELVFFRLGTEN